MNDPSYPTLSEAAQVEAQKVIDSFREKLIKIAEEAIGDMYVDELSYIESTAWCNFRNDMVDGMRGYNQSRHKAIYNWPEIRATILREHREELIEDLNQDHLAKIAELEKAIEFMQRMRY